jgi:hypothetical protein
MFQQTKEFTTLMELNAKKVFDGKVNIDHVVKMVSDETSEFFLPLDHFRDMILQDGKINEDAWPKDTKYYVNVFMQLIDGLWDALYYILQHLSTTKVNCDPILLTRPDEKVTEGFADFHTFNEAYFRDAIDKAKTSEDMGAFWSLPFTPAFTYANESNFIKVSKRFYMIVKGLSQTIKRVSQAQPPSNQNPESFLIQSLCQMANIISQITLWICTVQSDNGPIYVNGRKVWDLIHAANMRKFGSDGRLEGTKWIKPSNFVPPDKDIEEYLKSSLTEEQLVRHVKLLLRSYVERHLEEQAEKANRDPDEPILVSFECETEIGRPEDQPH